MRQSSTEFKTLLLKAGMGADLPLGLSEDLIRPSVWLQACGLEGDVEALYTLHCLDRGISVRGFPELSSQGTISAVVEQRVSAAYLGAQISDALQLGWPNNSSEIVFPSIDSPKIVAAAMVLAHRDLSLNFSIQAVAGELMFCSFESGKEVLVRQHENDGGLHGSRGSDLVIRAKGAIADTTHGDILVDGESEAHLMSHCREKGLNATTEVIRDLQSLASRLLVPETEQSLRFGAGAGIIATD